MRRRIPIQQRTVPVTSHEVVRAEHTSHRPSTSQSTETEKNLPREGRSAHPSRTADTAEASTGSVRTMRSRSSTDSSDPRSPPCGAPALRQKDTSLDTLYAFFTQKGQQAGADHCDAMQVSSVQDILSMARCRRGGVR
jgi:hypothetical protein